MSNTAAEIPSINAAPAEPAAPPSGRDANGRFTKGNRGGPGNPHARRVAALKQVILDALTAEKLRVIVDKLIALASEGDVAAAKLLFQYALGKPAEAVEPDRLDLNEWQQYQDQAGMLEEMPRVADKPAPALLLGFMRELRPVMTQQVARQMSAKFDESYAEEERARRESQARRDPAPAAKTAGGVRTKREGPAAPKANGGNGCRGESKARETEFRVVGSQTEFGNQSDQSDQSAAAPKGNGGNGSVTNVPEDLKELSLAELEELERKLREELAQSAPKGNGANGRQRHRPAGVDRARALPRISVPVNEGRTES